MTMFQNAVSAIAPNNTTISVSTIEVTPRICVMIRYSSSAMNVDSMNTSPCAKFTIPMIPNTIV